MSSNVENTGNNLKALALQVLKEYDRIPAEVSVIQSGSIKTVWKFKDGKGEYCLKRLKQTMDKALFSVNAQRYIKSIGGNVPGVCLNKRGEPIVTVNDQLFVVYEWVNGRDLNFGSRNDLALALGGLAQFHRASKGYRAGEGARVSSKLGKWPGQYESMKNKLAAWKEIAGAKGSPEHLAYLKWADPIIQLAGDAFLALNGSQYSRLTSNDSTVPVLCHQDFGKGNAVLTEKGVVVLDLDGVSFDLPARDLRKITGKMAQNTGRWDVRTIEDVLHWYSAANPVSEEEKRVLYIDLLFPHWFFGLVKNQYDNGKALKPSEIEGTARLEMSKVPVIDELLKR